MGRRRKQVNKIIRKMLPEIFLCPRCGNNTVKATINKKKNRAVVLCSNCSLTTTFQSNDRTSEVDVYCQFVDNYYHKTVEELVIG